MSFLDASNAALQLNKAITPPEMQAFHQELEQGYEETVLAIAPHCQPHIPKEKKEKGKRKKVMRVNRGASSSSLPAEEKK